MENINPIDEIKKLAIEFMEFDNLIPDSRIRQFVKDTYEFAVPTRFFALPASYSGKYHPGYSLGVGGLLRHTKAAMIIARDLFPLYNFTKTRQSLILAALALHDIAKPEKLHPVMVRDILLPFSTDCGYRLECLKILPLIESHMGQWNLDGQLPTPKREDEAFVHLCDYLASRKSIMVETSCKPPVVEGI